MPFSEADLDSVRRTMRAAVTGPKGFPSPPLPANAWKWMTGGQFLRARLVARLSIARHVPRERWARVAAAIELVHAASLLHDDVIDGALLRRHAPALWSVYGPRMAILAGDYLLAAALDLLDPTCPALRPAITAIVGAARITCTAEMERELAPQGGSGNRYTDEDLLLLARDKTGPLFSAAAIATLPANADPRRLRYWQETGFEIGLIYQMADDIADNDPSSGKTPGRDAARRLPTTASFATAGMLRERVDGLVNSNPEPSAATEGERTALAQYLYEDLLPALRPLGFHSAPKRVISRKRRPRP